MATTECLAVADAATAPQSVQLPLDLAFATDLLFHLHDVRAACASGLVAHGNLVTMLKGRIQLERTYAHELGKMTRFAQFDARETGTMQSAMASLRAHYLNTSVQHRQLATHLEEEVLTPIEKLYESNSERAQRLTRRLNHAKKSVKMQEEAYRKDYNAFDKTFREASASFASAMDSGFSSTLLEARYHHCLFNRDSPETRSPASAMATRTQRSSGTVALRSINNRKLVSWLLPTSESHRKEELANATVKLMAAAENARRKCQSTWQDVERHRIQLCRVMQCVLADYQELAEERIVTIITNLRKHVVYAASALANEQYDWQALAPQLENVNVQSDIQDFIHVTRGKTERVQLASLTVNDLCNIVAQSLVASPESKVCRPLRKSCLEIRDISSKNVPFDYDGNQELLGEVLRGYSSGSCEVETRLSHKSPRDLSDLQSDQSALSDASSADVDMAALGGFEIKEKRAIQSEPELDCDELTPSVSPSESGDAVSLEQEIEREATN